MAKQQATLTMTPLSALLLAAPVSAQTALDPASRAALDPVIDQLTRQEVPARAGCGHRAMPRGMTK